MSITQPVVPSVPSFRHRFFSHPVMRMALGVIVTLGPVTLTMMLADIFVPKALRAGGWPFLLAAAMSAAYLLTRRLWLPIGLHFGWNYLFDGVFAVPVSGHAARGWLQVSMPAPEWLSGGHYGVEASAAPLLVWATATLLLLRRARSK